MSKTQSNPAEELLSEVLEVAVSSWHIMLYNDDAVTFDWVIDNLVKYCGHHVYQAEQCAWLVHTRGKHAVKYGSKDDLRPICEALAEKGLTVKIESNE